MSNKLLWLRELDGTIEYFQRYLPDDINQQIYKFTMSDFEQYDQWIHLVGMRFLIFRGFMFELYIYHLLDLCEHYCK